MSNFKKQVKTFAGKVTIQDIQEEFDRLVNSINTAVDKINAFNEIQDHDFTKGSNKIANQNYTLTLGGLKQILNLYDGATIGGTCVNVNGACKVFPALYVDRNLGIKQVPDSYLTKNDNAIDLFFNPTTKHLGFPAGEWSEITPTGGAGEVYQNLTSNNDWGSITANANPAEAYKATTGAGFADNLYNSYPWTWTFPETRTLTQVVFSFIVGGQLHVNDYQKFRLETLDGRLIQEINMNYSNQTIVTINNKIYAKWDIDTGSINFTNTGGLVLKRIAGHMDTLLWFGLSLYGLGIQVLGASQAEIEGTPTQQGIDDLTGYKRIALLDWKRGFDVLNTTEDNILIQPEGKANIEIDKSIITPQTGGNGADTSRGQFICYRQVRDTTTDSWVKVGNDYISYAGHVNGAWSWNPCWVPPGVTISPAQTSHGKWGSVYKNYTLKIKGEET